jgi:acetyl esterase/lipase
MCAAPVLAASAATPPSVTVDADGTIHSDGLVVPLSDFLSPQARAGQAARLNGKPFPVATAGQVVQMRGFVDTAMKGIVAKWLVVAPARIHAEAMNGVQTDVVTPASGIAPQNAHRVLINLHGGGFFAGARSGGQAEAVPIAARGRIKVVTVDYRMAPEAKFPAASEDVEKVYRKLLETYKPQEIGIYGCSAGGTLVAQSTAWLQHKHLPRPGAIGIFCSGAMPGFWYGGDGFSVTQMMNGRTAATPADMRDGAGNLYMAGVDQTKDPLAAPALFPKVLAEFPPTLLLSSTRDSALSNVLVTNVRMLQAGVDTQLLVLEGLGHGEFDTLPGTPEATQAADLIWRFFDKHLAH